MLYLEPEGVAAALPVLLVEGPRLFVGRDVTLCSQQRGTK